MMGTGCWKLENLGRGLSRLSTHDLMEYTLNCVTLCLLYVGRPGQSSDKRMLLL